MNDRVNVLKKLQLPLILLSVLLLPLILGQYIPIAIKSSLYALSLSMKSILIAILPFIIFSFVFSCLLSLKSGVISFVLLLIVCVFLSNSLAILTGYQVGATFLPMMNINVESAATGITLLPAMWDFMVPRLVSNEIALISSFVLGFLFTFYPHPIADKVAGQLNRWATVFLKKVFIPLLPLFILGFVLKLEHDQILAQAFTVYGPVLLIVLSTQICYIIAFYFVATGFSLKRSFIALKNVFPATLTGFSTVSSAATMPVLLLQSEKNIKDVKMVKSIIPAVINIHTLGSAIGLTILSLTTLLTFGMEIPPINVFISFAFFYALAKFAVAAVPGGAIIVAAPLLETYLGYTPEMIGLITAMYMIFDLFGTATNVTGNGGFAILFSKIYGFFNPPSEPELAKEA